MIASTWSDDDIAWTTKASRPTTFLTSCRYSLIWSNPFFMLCNMILNWKIIARVQATKYVFSFAQIERVSHVLPFLWSYLRTLSIKAMRQPAGRVAPSRDSRHWYFLSFHLEEKEIALVLTKIQRIAGVYVLEL